MKVRVILCLLLILIPIQYYIITNIEDCGLLSEEQFDLLSTSIGIFLLICAVLLVLSAVITLPKQSSKDGKQVSFMEKIKKGLDRDTGKVIKATMQSINNKFAGFSNFFKKIEDAITELKTTFPIFKFIFNIFKSIYFAIKQLLQLIFTFVISIFVSFKSFFSSIGSSVKNYGNSIYNKLTQDQMNKRVSA